MLRLAVLWGKMKTLFVLYDATCHQWDSCLMKYCSMIFANWISIKTQFSVKPFQILVIFMPHSPPPRPVVSHWHIFDLPRLFFIIVFRFPLFSESKISKISSIELFLNTGYNETLILLTADFTLSCSFFLVPTVLTHKSFMHRTACDCRWISKKRMGSCCNVSCNIDFGRNRHFCQC